MFSCRIGCFALSFFLALLPSALPQAAPKSRALIARLPEHFDLENCEPATTLRVLAALAGGDAFVAPAISGTVSMRFDGGITPRDAIRVLTNSNNLSLRVEGAIFTVDVTPQTVDVHRSGRMGNGSPATARDGLAETINRTYDAMLEYLDKPEVIAKIARQQRNYYLALIKEGFTAEEATRMAAVHNGLETPLEAEKSK